MLGLRVTPPPRRIENKHLFPVRLGRKVREALLLGDIGHAQPVRGEGLLERLGRELVLGLGAADRRVDEGQDAAQLRRGRERGVAAQRRGRLRRRVEVLLRRHQLRRPRKHLRVVAERSDDLVREREL